MVLGGVKERRRKVPAVRCPPPNYLAVTLGPIILAVTMTTLPVEGGIVHEIEGKGIGTMLCIGEDLDLHL